MPLGKNADAGDYVKDFQKSDAPQFKGKSKEKRRKMAIAAYLDSKDKKESKMKSFDDIRAEINEAKYKVHSEGALNKKAVETGKVKTGPSKSRMSAMQKQYDNRPTLRKNEDKKMDSAAMKKAMDAFKKRGGKIKKVAPGKAAGYHGKDDPGAGVQGMMDRGDTKGMPRKKKIRSMR